MKYQVDKTKYTRVVRKFLEKQVPAETVRYINAIALDIQGALIKETPVDTGQLMRGWEFLPTTHHSQSAEIVNRVPYGPHVNYGTSRMTGRFFLQNVAGRAGTIAEATIRRLGGK